MSQNITYHEVRAQNDKSSFIANDLVDFELDAQGRSIIQNSIEFSGQVKVYKNSVAGANQVLGDDVGNLFVNESVGAHTFFESIATSTLNQGSLENIAFAYPRFKNVMDKLDRQEQERNQVSSLCEWIVPDKVQTDSYLRETFLKTGTPEYNETPSFSIKPFIVLNRTDKNIPFSRTGKIRISINLTDNSKAIENLLTDPGVTSLVYTIENLRCRFRSVPDSGDKSVITSMKVVPMKTSINSTLANMSFNVPSEACSGVSVSFQTQSSEGDQAKDECALEKVNVNSIQYFFNSANSYLNYELNDLSEIVQRGLKSLSPLNDKRTYDVSQQALASNKGFVIGTDMDGIVDLSQNSFEVQLNSDIANTKNVYLHFHSLVSM
jgi:hypothetical protein